MPDYKALIAQNNDHWLHAQFHPEAMAHARSKAQKICAPAAKAVYVKIQALTSVPWWVVGVIHYRECGLSWKGSLAQGDPWNQVSRHDPRGRGPFASFLQAALDALQKCAPFAARWKDWSPGGALTLLELYNGTGYEHHGVASPYVWGGTTIYRHGKFVADHKYDPNAVDQQLGCAILIKAMQEIDDSVMVFGTGEDPNPDEYPEPQHVADLSPPSVSDPAPAAGPADPDPDDQPAAPSIMDTAKERVKQVATDKVEEAVANPGLLERGKSMFMSKIAWLQGTAITAGGAAATSDDSVWGELVHLAHKPMFWLLVVVIVSALLTIFFRWRDHGRGAGK